MNRRLALLPQLAAAMLTLAACGGNTPGTPSSTSAATSGSASSATSTSTTSDVAGELRATDPCSLLNTSVLSQYGLKQGKPSTGSGARSCQWQTPVDQNGNGYTIGVDIRDSQGIKDINSEGYTVTDDPINGQPAKQMQQTDLCAVVLGVTDSSRVDVSAVDDGGNTTNTCQTSNEFAKLIEPELPGGKG